MKVPQRLRPLVEEGLVDDVLSQLMSGKEATVYVVRCGDDVRCAKVYKDAKQRSFKNAVSYTEGRKVKNSRQARAMEKGTRYGKQMQEELWQNAEVQTRWRGRSRPETLHLHGRCALDGVGHGCRGQCGASTQ